MSEEGEEMKIVQINATCGVGSTGKICVDISKILDQQDIENYILYANESNGYKKGISYASRSYISFQSLKSHLLGNYGFNSRRSTIKIIKELDKIRPDIVHLHNIHGHDCNIEMLFSYFKENKIKLIWTFHDCWAFTAYCPHFTLAKCDKWKSECKECPQYRDYSFFFDKSYYLYQKKKQLFEGLDMTIVTPSQWLSNLVKKSFLKEYPIKIINNGIDLEVFKPTESDFRRKYDIPQSKKIVLGVAFDWGRRKGLDIFIELAKRLEGEKYQIVLVGTNESVERQLPDNVISIHRTQNQTELAKIYTAADVFVNPTREEVLGLTNIEANACGTPVLTFRTGGSPECIDASSGAVIDEDIQVMVREIMRICEEKPFDGDVCRERAKKFNKNNRFKEYVRLYESVNT